jgi:lipopolysaccharide export system protein LptA
VRLTIERMRTLVLAAGVLLIAALVGFLVAGKWKHRFNLREIPKRLGVDITQEANGYTFSHAFGEHSQYKIHASKVVQLKQGKAVLHDVQIELYGEDGSRVDRIVGDEFEYDQKNGTATAAGPVEITLMRPSVAPAVAPNATPTRALADKDKTTPLVVAAKTASGGEIHVKTSGLTFVQATGVATTAARVEFSVAQGSGSSVGATYDSQAGSLLLDHAVELSAHRGPETVFIKAQHAEFERGDLLCNLTAASASYRAGQATAGEARIAFRPDGTAIRLDATKGFSVVTATGAHVVAPLGMLEFDEHNQPRHGHLQGGVILDSERNGRHVHGTSPVAELEFTPLGQLRRAHLERGVAFHSEQTSVAQDTHGTTLREIRDWRSQIAEVGFREARAGVVELAQIRGTGGVILTGESQRGSGPVIPSRLTADEMNGVFGIGQQLTEVIGSGHAIMEQTTAAGTRQKTTGDRLDAHFAPAPASASQSKSPVLSAGASAQVESISVDGNVVLEQNAASKPGAKAPALLRANAGRAIYEGASEWLHLSGSPRVEDGGLQLSADKVDVSNASSDAFAHGNVKATWVDQGRASGPSTASTGSLALGGQGPAHVIADEAQLRQQGEATFSGKARLWQQGNSISAPAIVLDRTRGTLVAHSSNTVQPVSVVLVSAASPASAASGTGSKKGAPSGPTVVRVRGADLKYSEAERKVVIHAAEGGTVVAEAGTSTSTSSEVEVLMLPPGNHAAKNSESAQVDQVIARGHVEVSSQGGRGTGEQLVYSSETGDYVLTGTATAPPVMTYPARGKVTGQALIFNSHNDSVGIEGGGRKTTTDTTAPK